MDNEFFDIISIDVINQIVFPSKKKRCLVEIRINVKGKLIMTAAEGNGPVNAFDKVLRKVLKKNYKDIDISTIRLIEYVPVVVNVESDGTTAKVVTKVAMRYNGDLLEFEGKSTDIEMSGIFALMKGYHECLKRLCLRKGGEDETHKVSH